MESMYFFGQYMLNKELKDSGHIVFYCKMKTFR